MKLRTKVLVLALGSSFSLLGQTEPARAQTTTQPAATTAVATTTTDTTSTGTAKPANPSDTSDEIESPVLQTTPASATAPATDTSGIAKTSQTAAATATPLSGARGGTLGFPAMGAPGIVAALSLQGSSGQTTKLDVIAQIGQIELLPWLTLDVVVEKVSTDIPTATFTPNTGRPLAKLIQTDLTSAGFRLRFGRKGANNQQLRRLSECLTAKRLTFPEAKKILNREKAKAEKKVQDAQAVKDAKDADITAAKQAEAEIVQKYTAKVAEAKAAATCPQVVPDDAKVPSDADTFEYYQQAAESSNAGWSLSLGTRLLYRTQDIAGSAPGAAAEFTPQYGFKGGSAIFASGTYLWLRGNETETDGIHATTSELHEIKTTVGAYYKFNAPLRNVQTAPRLGGYASFARNFWTNPYPSPGTDPKIRGYQLEGGVFVSGHFSGGFNGLLQMGLRRSYGVDSKPEFFFAIVPSLGTETGGAT